VQLVQCMSAVYAQCVVYECSVVYTVHQLARRQEQLEIVTAIAARAGAEHGGGQAESTKRRVDAECGEERFGAGSGEEEALEKDWVNGRCAGEAARIMVEQLDLRTSCRPPTIHQHTYTPTHLL
jgi:hypothetical protein